MDCVTRWIDARIDRFAVIVADRLLEKSGLDDIGEMFGAWLLGLNEQLKNDLP
jgi:hypothetical protein